MVYHGLPWCNDSFKVVLPRSTFFFPGQTSVVAHTDRCAQSILTKTCCISSRIFDLRLDWIRADVESRGCECVEFCSFSSHHFQVFAIAEHPWGLSILGLFDQQPLGRRKEKSFALSFSGIWYVRLSMCEYIWNMDEYGSHAGFQDADICIFETSSPFEYFQRTV